jgi:hypothetical protein
VKRRNDARASLTKKTEGVPEKKRRENSFMIQKKAK